MHIEFFNVDELLPVEGLPGKRLYRFPKTLAESLGETWQHNARFRSQRAHGCELRFVTQARCFDLALTAYGDSVDLLIYRGDRFMERRNLPEGKTTVVHVDLPAMEEAVDPAALEGSRFPSRVWRILCGMNGYLHFHSLDTYGWPCRPPRPDEEPVVRWLAYGSSITCGHVTTLYTNAYIYQAARRLGWDVLNKGLSGSCFCEKQIADYLAAQPVDYITVEVGVNMAPSFNETEYTRRLSNLLSTLRDSGHAKKYFVIDSFPCYGAVHRDPNLPAVRNYLPFKKITRELVAKMRDDRFISICGEDILQSMDGLSCDLLHPSDEGHILMGQALAEKILKNI